MALQRMGRRIGADRRPVEGTGFEVDTESRLGQLIAQRNSPIVSQPTTGEWVVGLVTSQESGGAFERGLGIFPPGNAGPAEHIHPTYDEHFEVVQGSFIFRLAGQERTVTAGETVVVPKGTAHTFRCVGDTIAAAVVESRPAARLGDVIVTLFGMAHEGKLTKAGQPKLLHAMVVADEYSDDTIFTSPPPSVTIAVAKVFAPLGRLLGYRASEPRYANPDFWTAHVEQP